MSTVMDQKERQKAQWSAAAAGWDRWFDWYARAFGPLMEWCCDAAGLAPGDRVLDLACGSGLPALLAARRVGPAGRVVAVDLSPDMLAVARRRAHAAGLDNLEFMEMDAERLHFADASFDAVTCACGLMFLPDASGALGEIRRVLMPRGRLAAGVWDDPSKSPFLTTAGRAVAEYFPPSGPPDPKTPGAFRFAPPGVLESMLADAGFSSVTVRSLPMPIECASATQYWQVFVDMAAGIKEKVATLPRADQARLEASVIEAASAYLQDGLVRLSATALCAAATR